MVALFIVGGLVLLFFGGEALVRGSVGIARRFGISELVIGLTLVGFGTSVPELVTSLRAVSQDAVGMSVGNVAGSNTANLLLVLGVAALIRPFTTHPMALARDFTVMILATIIFVALAWFDIFTRPAGLILLVVLIAYMVASMVMDQGPGAGGEVAALHAQEGEEIETDDPVWLAALLAVGGIIGVIVGARLLVSGGIAVAEMFGISDTVIGLTIVAIGTSLPELATSAVSAWRGKSDVALGNVLGSNIFNSLGIVGATALISPFSLRAGAQLSHEGAEFDYGRALGEGGFGSTLTNVDVSTLILSGFLVALFAFTGKRMARWEGGVLLIAYLLYMGFLFNLVPTPFS